MIISVQFYGFQRTLTQTHEIEVSILKAGKVKDVFVFVKENYPDLHLNEKETLITVNNRLSRMNGPLKPKDKVAFLPHIGGG